MILRKLGQQDCSFICAIIITHKHTDLPSIRKAVTTKMRPIIIFGRGSFADPIWRELDHNAPRRPLAGWEEIEPHSQPPTPKIPNLNPPSPSTTRYNRRQGEADARLCSHSRFNVTVGNVYLLLQQYMTKQNFYIKTEKY